MATAARTWRAAAALLMLTAAGVARSQYVAPAAPAMQVGPGTAQSGEIAAAGAERPLTRPWTVRPEIKLRETYTDNAFFGTGPARSDFITQVTPGIRIDGASPRLIASLNYAPSALFYARNSEANDFVNNLDAYSRVEAVEKFFFIEASGRISQDFINPFVAQPADITTATSARREIRTVSLSPFVRHARSDLEFELRNANFWTDSDTAGLGRFRTEKWTGHVTRPVRRFGATLEFDHTDISYYDSLVERSEDKSRLYRARLYWQPDPAWRLSVSGGEEENNYVLHQMERSSIYGAALAWRPSPRTSADLEYESRFFGPSRLARFAHRTRLSSWNVTYSRNTSTFQQEVLRLPPGNTSAVLDAAFLARFPGPDQRRAAVDQFINASGTPAFLANSLAFYTQRVYVREGVDASAAFIGRRNSIAFTAFAVESSDISADALGLVPDTILQARKIKQRGFGAYAQHSLTPSTSVGAQASRIFARGEQPDALDSRNDYLTLTLNHTVSPKTTAFTGASSSRFRSDDPGTASEDATSVFIGVNHRF